MQVTPDMAGPDSDLTGAKVATAQSITCFTPGTRITTIRGAAPVETLVPGDRILTRDRGFQPLIWLGWRPFCASGNAAQAADAPVRIRAGALGAGMPERDLVVSGHHHVLSLDQDCLNAHCEPETLIEARALVGRPGIEHLHADRLCYMHLLLEHHEVILSENAWTESFLLTPEAHSALHAVAPAGIGDLPAHRPARQCLRQSDLATARP